MGRYGLVVKRQKYVGSQSVDSFNQSELLPEVNIAHD